MWKMTVQRCIIHSFFSCFNPLRLSLIKELVNLIISTVLFLFLLSGELVTLVSRSLIFDSSCHDKLNKNLDVVINLVT